jgi:hypothetical protein
VQQILQRFKDTLYGRSLCVLSLLLVDQTFVPFMALLCMRGLFACVAGKWQVVSVGTPVLVQECAWCQAPGAGAVRFKNGCARQEQPTYVCTEASLQDDCWRRNWSETRSHLDV